MELELWDTAGSRAMGVKIASASAALDLAMFKPFAAQPATIDLCGQDGKVLGSHPAFCTPLTETPSAVRFS